MLMFEMDQCTMRRAAVVRTPIAQVTLHATLPVIKHYDIQTGMRRGPVSDADINVHMGHLKWPMVVYDMEANINNAYKKVVYLSTSDDVMHVAIEYRRTIKNRPTLLKFHVVTIDVDFSKVCFPKPNHILPPSIATVLVWKDLQMFEAEQFLLKHTIGRLQASKTKKVIIPVLETLKEETEEEIST